jgi:hypothetical protein
MQKLFNTAQNALNESSSTMEKLRQLSKESHSTPTSPKAIRANSKLSSSSSWSYNGEEKHMSNFLQKMKEAVADTFQSAA